MLNLEIKTEILKMVFGIEPKTICEVLDLDIENEDKIVDFLADNHELILVLLAIREKKKNETGVLDGHSRRNLCRGNSV